MSSFKQTFSLGGLRSRNACAMARNPDSPRAAGHSRRRIQPRRFLRSARQTEHSIVSFCADSLLDRITPPPVPEEFAQNSKFRSGFDSCMSAATRNAPRNTFLSTPLKELHAYAATPYAMTRLRPHEPLDPSRSCCHKKRTALATFP